jgi:hypothetical protein
MTFASPKTLYEFSSRIRGTSPSGISLILAEFHLLSNMEAVTNFSRKPLTEINLFKSVFLIYDWVQIAYTDAYAVSLGSKIYNEFIVDFNNKPGSQEDIYFIRHELINETTKPLLERLIDINLLASASFAGGGLGVYTTYFITLDKPGMPREAFRHSQDPMGDKTYNLWKLILQDRDFRFSLWTKNRF